MSATRRGNEYFIGSDLLKTWANVAKNEDVEVICSSKYIVPLWLLPYSFLLLHDAVHRQDVYSVKKQ